MPENRTQMRAELMALGLSERRAKNAVSSLARSLEFREIAALFAGDPTALVATLRAHGFEVDARYARPAPPKQVAA